MNSITPIASLARTADGLVDDLKVQAAAPTDPESLGDIHDALSTIARRSEGLLEFVRGYRRLTDIPKPRLREVEVGELLTDVVQLCEESLAADGVMLSWRCDPHSLRVSADPALIQQVLINLVRNAAHALENVEADRHIRIQAGLVHGRVNVSVSDNGCGIPAEELPMIFIPFFTTKKKGSGVGMTLARQIMSAHGGGVSVHSQTGSGTVVTLSF